MGRALLPRHRLATEQLEAGALPAARVVGPISRTDIVRYQGASGDFNPVHHDELFARAAGYPAPLGIGMFQDDYEPHLVAGHAGIIVVEKLTNLSELPARGAFFIFLPWKVKKASGGLGRAIAIV